jgi:hypothetical protein
MKEPYIEGLATLGGPESCVVVREGGGEALTGVRAGRDIEPRNIVFWGADAVGSSGRQHLRQRYSRVAVGPCAVEDPVHVRNLHAREPGDPILARRGDRAAGRLGNAVAVIPG